MISTRYISRYPLDGLAVSVVSEIDRLSSLKKRSENFLWQAVALVSAFFDVQDKVLQRIEDMHPFMDLFSGFLTVECGMTSQNNKKYCSIVFSLLQPSNNSMKVDKWTYEHSPYSAVNYKKLVKNQEKIKYYKGWYCSPQRSKKKIFLDFIRFYRQFGGCITKKYFDSISMCIERNRASSAQTIWVKFKKFLELLIVGFRSPAELKLLEDPIEVNIFFEEMYAYSRAKYLEGEGQDRTFHVEWSRIVCLVSESLIEDGILAEPVYDIFKPAYNRTKEERAGRKNGFIEPLTRLLTELPEDTSDEDAAASILKYISDDIDIVDKSCRYACEDILTRQRNRKLSAVTGSKIYIDHGATSYSFADMCATWESSPYSLPNWIVKKYPGGVKKFAHDIGIARTADLLPFLYRLVIVHPQITPAWLLSVEVFDENHRPTGYGYDGIYLVGEKARRGIYCAQQQVPLTDESEKILKDVLELTAQAREYLKKNGEDSYRYLLLGGGKSLGKPSITNRLYPANAEVYRNSILVQNLLDVDDVKQTKRRRSLLQAMSLVSVRASCGVIVYLNTLSVRRMAEALGHKEYSPDLISKYLPRWIHEYFLSKWVRTYQNCIIYSSMKESSYLIESMSFNCLQDIADFTKIHKFDLESIMRESREETASNRCEGTKYSQANIVLNELSFKFLLSYAEACELLKAAGHQFSPSAKCWYELAAFVVGAKNLHLEGNFHDISSDVANLFVITKSSRDLTEKLCEVISAAC